MAENYIVNYSIKVQSSSAIKAINKFKKATNDLAESANKFNYIRKEVGRTVAAINKLSNSKLIINTENAHRSLDKIIVKLERIAQLSMQSNMSLGASNTNRVVNSTSGKTDTFVVQKPSTSKPKNPKSPKQPNATKPSAKNQKQVVKPNHMRNNYSYRTLGPSMLDNGGLAGLNFLKGMGIAYGISAVGSLIGNVMKDAAEYDNIIQTTKNILSAHDTAPNFEKRFKQMESAVREVGIKTKFTAPESADASRFLAMAGMNIDDIKKSIRPIADIALIGDTDLGSTADVVTNIMTGYGITADNLRHTTDVMTQTFTMSNVTLMEIASSYKYVASLLKSAGVSFEEATAAIGILGNSGIKGSQAGTVMRTIMTNLLKPTKSQQKVWNEIGVSRFDNNGNLRDLVDIFTDLSKKNLKTSSFFRMFNTRAAQGAVSLVSNVDEWNKIIQENLISSGLTADLSKEKQNTIQGLWAQLTSRFTEEGLRAFEELEERIRGFLKDIIQWIDSEDGSKFIHKAGNAVMDFMEVIKTFTKRMMDIYNKFSPIINGWIKYQLYIGSALIPLRILKGLKTAVKFLYAGSKGLNFFNGRLIALGKTFLKTNGFLNKFFATLDKHTTTKGTTFTNSSNTDYHSYIISKEEKDRFKELKEKNHMSKRRLMSANFLQHDPIRASLYPNSEPYQNTLLRTRSEKSKTLLQDLSIIEKYKQRHALYRSIGGNIGGVVGAGLGGYAGMNLGSGGADTMLYSLALGGVGGAAGQWLGGQALGLAASAFSNPVTAIVAITAVLGAAGYAFYKYTQSVNEAAASNARFIEEASVVNGINMSEHATMADKYLAIIHDKRMSLNEATQKYIDLLNEEYGLNEKLQNQANNNTKAKDKYKGEYEKWSKPFGFLTGAATWNNAVNIEGEFKPTSIKQPGRSQKYQLFDRIFEQKDLNKLSAAQIIASKVGDISQNGELYKDFSKYDKLLLSAKSVEDIEKVLKQVRNYVNGLSYTKESLNWTTSDISDKTIDQWNHSWAGVQILKKRFGERYDIYNQNSKDANVQKFQVLVKILEAYQNGQEIENEKLYEFLRLSGAFYFDKRKFGAFGTVEWLKNIGFDVNENQWVGTKDKTAEQARNAFIGFHKSLIDMVNQLHPAIRKYFDNIINNFMFTLPTLDQDSNAPSLQAMYNGTKYQFDGSTNSWVPIGNSVMLPIANDKFQQLTGGKLINNPLDPNITGGSNVSGNYNLEGDSNKYKRHYNTGNAAPKQINVTIQNLMNVDKIDMSDPKKKEIIDNIKSEMAYALIDVVRDFDETFHG